MKFKHLLLAAAVTLTAATGLAATPASAKSQSFGAMSCVGDATGQTSFADLGSGRFNVGFVTNQAAVWNVKVFMDGAATPRSNYTTPSSQTLSLIAVINAGKGKHRFEVLATNLTTGGTCDAFVGSGV